MRRVRARLVTDGVHVDEVFRPWYTRRTKLGKRGGGTDARLVGLLLGLATEGEHGSGIREGVCVCACGFGG